VKLDPHMLKSVTSYRERGFVEIKDIFLSYSLEAFIAF
jgi:hypothetical protein